MKIKPSNIKKFFIGSLIVSTGLALSSNMKSLASSKDVFFKDGNIRTYESLDLTNVSMIKNWGGSQEDKFNSVAHMLDGGFITVGASDSTDLGFENKGGYDGVIVKYNKDGNQEWIKGFGGSRNDFFHSVAPVLDGGFVVVGTSVSDDMEFTNNGRNDAVIVKYDKDGNQEWINSFGGSSYDYFYSTISTADEGFIAVGESGSTDAGFENRGVYDAVIVKYNKEGNQEWVKTLAGSRYDCFYSVVSVLDEGFVVVGESNSNDIGFEHKGDEDAIIAKYDKDGNQEWINNFGGSDTDSFKSLAFTSDTGFIAVGYSYSEDAGFENKGNYDAIVVKYNEDGNQEWIKSYGDLESDSFYSIIPMADKGFVVVGESESVDAGFENKGDYDAIIAKYDEEGSQEWIESFGGSSTDSFKSLAFTSDGGFVVVGESYSEDAEFGNNGDLDGIIVKYNGSNTDIDRLEPKVFSANLDIYIKSENMLLMNLSTNSIAFDDYSGVDEIEKTNALNISINSSLPYQLNAYLVSDIQNDDGSNKIDINRLNIKDNSELSYSEFSNINEQLVLKDNCDAGNDKEHSIDLKLKGGNAYPSDIYKTIIKFEAEQK